MAVKAGTASRGRRSRSLMSINGVPVGFTPKNLFTGGLQGGWWDPSDLTTLFQDAAGTIPVTGFEQPVGRMLDKSGNGNHLIQATASQRPVLSARFNLVTGSDVFSNQTVVIPAPGNYWVTFWGYAAQGTLSFSTSVSQVQSFPLAGGGLQAAGQVYLPAGSCSITGVGEIRFVDVRAVTNVVPGKRTPCQRVGSSAVWGTSVAAGVADYDVTAVTPYLAFDGVGTCLYSAANVDLSGSAQLSVWFGLEKYLDTPQAILLETSARTDLNAGSFSIADPQGTVTYHGFAIQSESYGATNANWLGDVSGVITGVIDRPGGTLDLYGNLDTTHFAGTTGAVFTGNFGSYPLYVGMRANTSLPFTGKLYGLVLAGRLAAAGEQATVVNWLNLSAMAF